MTIELEPLSKDEWMPRVRVQVLQGAQETRKVADELENAGIRSDIQTLDIVGQRFGEWPEGYVVRLRQEPSPVIGWAHARLLERTPRTADLSWETARPFQGHGYMREAIPRIVEWLVRRRGIAVVSAWVPSGHEQSEKVAQAGGLHPTGTSDPARRTLMWERTAPILPNVD